MYKLNQGSSSITRLQDKAQIPMADGNKDYEAYKEWLTAGNVPQPPDPVVPTVPESVTMRQARLALLQVGLLSQVNAAIAAMSGVAGDAARIEWEFGSTVDRGRPLVQSLAGALSLTSTQLDDLFVLAASL